MINWLQAHYLDLGQAGLAFMGFFSIVAKLTPTKSDDKLLDKIFSVVHKFGLSKKEP